MIQLTAHKNKRNGGVKMKISKKVKKNLIFVVSLAFILTNCYFMIFGTQTVKIPGVTEPKLASEETKILIDSLPKVNPSTSETTSTTSGSATQTTTPSAVSGSAVTTTPSAVSGSAISSEGGGVMSEAIKEDADVGFIDGLVSGLVTVFLWIPRICIMGFGKLLQLLMNACASIGTSNLTSVTIEHILFAGYQDPDGSFGGIDFMDVNFFNIEGSDTIVSFRTAVAKWYYIMRLISASILLVILIYVGIRMALSTIASEQAKYKQMLVDWATSLALLFMLHYIMIFFVSINTTLVSALGGMLKGTLVTDDSLLMKVVSNAQNVLHGGKWTPTIGEYLNAQIVKDVWANGIAGFFAAIMYCIMQGQAFSYLMFYLKRMITIGFLIIIAPLITITYSIDKMGDGKAQALNAWLKEFAYNILIQPFHCVVYLAFFGAISQIIAKSTWGFASIGVYILAFAVLRFMRTAEELLRKIFHFEAQSMPGLSAPGRDFMNATGKFAKMGMGVAKSATYFKNAGGFNKLTSGVRNLGAKRDVKKDKMENDGMTKQEYKAYKKTDQYKDDVRQKVAERKENKNKKVADRRQEKHKRHTAKARKQYDALHGDGAYDVMIENATKAAYDEAHGQGEYEKLKRQADRRNPDGTLTTDALIAKRTMSEAQQKMRETKNGEIIHDTSVPTRAIKGISNAYDGVKRWTQTDSAKVIGAALKDTASVTSTIAGIAFGYGASGDLSTGYSVGELVGGKGFVGGILERVSDTSTQETAALVSKMAVMEGWDQAEAKAKTTALLAQAATESNAGLYKELVKEQRDLVSKLTGLLHSQKAASEFVYKAQIQSIDKDQILDINAIMENLSLSSSVTDAEKAEAIEASKKFLNTYIKSQLATSVSSAKDTNNYDVDTYGGLVVKKVDVDYYQPDEPNP